MQLLQLAILLCALITAQAAAPSTVAPSSAKGAINSSSSSSNSNNNPILESALFPEWDKITHEHVVPAVKQVIEEESASLALLEADLTKAGKDVTFDRVFKPFTQIRYRLDTTFGLIDHLQSVMDSPALRKAIEQSQPLRVTFELKLGQSKPIYEAVTTLKNTPSIYNKLSAERQRIVDLMVKDFRTSGVGLPPEQRKKYNELVDRQAKVATNFTNNVLDSTAAFKLLVTDKKQLEGLEPTTLAVAASKAKEAGHKTASAEGGPWLLTLDYTTYSAVVSFASDQELRKKVYTAYRRIAADGKSDNTALIKQLLAGRQELSRILGFPNYAEQAFLGRMATFKQANDLMDELTKVSRPVAVKEDQVLTTFARNATGDPQLKLLWWDNAYWAERMKEATFKVKQEELRQYLPLPNVKQGLFKLVNRLYGITLRPSKNQLPVWHPDVELYEVLDGNNSDKPIAYFYMDLYARPGTKQGGAWVQALSDRAHYWREPSPAARAAAAAKAQGKNASDIYSEALVKEQAAWLDRAPMHPPVAMLVANQNPPAGGKPSLMTMDDAETLFHEAGHALQAMLTTAKEGLTAGMRMIEWDAVEAPSQMQEKWVYDRDTFNSFARHWQTGQPVPPELFDRIKAMRTYRRGNYFTYQLMLATTDMILHSSFDPLGSRTAADIQQQQYAKIMPFAPYSQDRQINSFSHVFTGGYSAGYYSYVWADVMSADGFMAFVEAGTSNDAEIQRLGRLFRNTFLSLGGSVPPAEVFKRFRGRAPEVEALIKYNALTITKRRQ